MENEFTPILPPTAAASPAAGSANRAGEPAHPASGTSSSRPKRDRRLAGVLAASLLSASLASVVTVGALVGTGVVGGGGVASPAAEAASSAATATPESVTISASDAVVAVAEKASPAVVTITVESAGSGGFGPMSMPSTGVGSGFVFDRQGHPDHHHARHRGQRLDHGHLRGRRRARGHGPSPTTPSAIWPSSRSRPRTCRRSRSGILSALEVGQLVVAIGSPLGTFSETVTSGILSATGRTIEVGSAYSRQTTTMTGLLQTDAAINEGNSGGPLLDANGAVIGVNVAVATSAQGIGFAIPIDDAAEIMAEARGRRRARRSRRRRPAP
jgi:S1-C subfamily serine protease